MFYLLFIVSHDKLKIFYMKQFFPRKRHIVRYNEIRQHTVGCYVITTWIDRTPRYTYTMCNWLLQSCICTFFDIYFDVFTGTMLSYQNRWSVMITWPSVQQSIVFENLNAQIFLITSLSFLIRHPSEMLKEKHMCVL